MGELAILVGRPMLYTIAKSRGIWFCKKVNIILPVKDDTTQIVIAIHMKNTIYAEDHFGRAGMFDEAITNNFKPVFCKTRVDTISFFLNPCLLPGTFNTLARQNVNYTFYANNIHRFTRYVNWQYYSNQENLVIDIVEDTSLCNGWQDFISNKQLEPEDSCLKKMPSSPDTYACNFLYIS